MVVGVAFSVAGFGSTTKLTGIDIELPFEVIEIAPVCVPGVKFVTSTQTFAISDPVVTAPPVGVTLSHDWFDCAFQLSSPPPVFRT